MTTSSDDWQLPSILMDIREKLGEVKAETRANRQALFQRTDDMMEHIDHRFGEVHITLEKHDQQINDLRHGKPKRWSPVALLWHLPWKHMIGLGVMYLIGLMGHVFPPWVRELMRALAWH